MRLFLSDYIWFIKQSLDFMEGVYPKPIIFILSLFKGFGFCINMNKSRRGV